MHDFQKTRIIILDIAKSNASIIIHFQKYKSLRKIPM